MRSVTAVSSTHAKTPQTEPVTPAGLEPVRLIRGASRGFSVLAIGAAVQPLVGVISAPVGYVWLVIVAVAAFAVAAWNAHETTAPHIQGAASAIAAYALMLPLVLMGAGTLPWDQALFTTATAIGVGTATAFIRTRTRGAQPKG